MWDDNLPAGGKRFHLILFFDGMRQLQAAHGKLQLQLILTTDNVCLQGFKLLNLRGNNTERRFWAFAFSFC